MLRYFLSAIPAGLAAAALFILVLISGLGFFFLFLPTLPIFWLGLGRAPRLALAAALIAALFIGTFTEAAVGAVFFLLFGLPAYYISRLALLSRGQGSDAMWFPIGLIFTRLTFYACAFMAFSSVYLRLQGNGLEALLADHIRLMFTGTAPEYAETVEALASHWVFLIFALGCWLWGLALYAHAWVINRRLVKSERAVRPDFAVTAFTPPGFLPLLLMLCAVGSLVGSAETVFLGKSLLIALLMPYFFLGAALMHEHTKSWPSRGFFLFFIYSLVFMQFWPALILAVYGLIAHIKRLSAARDSTRN